MHILCCFWGQVVTCHSVTVPVCTLAFQEPWCPGQELRLNAWREIIPDQLFGGCLLGSRPLAGKTNVPPTGLLRLGNLDPEDEEAAASYRFSKGGNPSLGWERTC